MILLLSTFAICLVSALVPVVNAEAYLGAMAAVGVGSQLWPIALTAALGQTAGKATFFLIGRNSLDWRWVRRKTESPRWQTQLARWQRRAHDNPWSVTGLVTASALVSLPPLAIISMLAGQLRASFPLFILAVLTGRTLRFAAVFASISAINPP